MIFKVADEEVSGDKIRIDLIKKYENYFSHFKSYSVLLAFCAMIGLLLSVLNWEETFVP
jgi:hypothetical protein